MSIATENEVKPETTTDFPVKVTEAAAEEVKRHIVEMQKDDEFAGEQLYMRVRVQGGGCSGFEDKLEMDTKYNEKLDNLYEMHGVKLVVDKRSLLYLEGATIDFHSDLNRRGFRIVNPNAKKTCGCGSSYSM